jgi:hypothetical protein
MSYAKNTTVSIDRSMAQIRIILSKAGADGTAIAEASGLAMVQFSFEGKAYKFFIHYPGRNNDQIKFTSSGKERTENQIELEIEKEKKRLWRSMGLYIKAAIEAHENGIIDLKKSMLAHMLLPNGGTVYEKVESSIGKIETNPKFLLS